MKQKLILLLLFPFAFTYAQPAFKKKEYTGVVCKLYINYERGLSNGEYVYPRYNIVAGKREYMMERTLRSGIRSDAAMPYPLKEQEKKTDTTSLAYVLWGIGDHYSSQIESYAVNGKTYKVLKHITYNCYDPFCSSHHGHVTQTTGIAWFQPDYGMLIWFDDPHQYEVMQHINEVQVPYELIIAIMKANGFPDNIIEQYKKDTGG